MSPLQLLYAEAQPTGEFGGPRPQRAAWTPEEQAQHRADLLAALAPEPLEPIPTRRQANRRPRKANQ